MFKSEKKPTVVQPPPTAFFPFSVDTRSLASLQCLSFLKVKEPDREGIQVAFSEMVGSASSPVCVHGLCLLSSSAVLCCNDHREDETAGKREGKKKITEKLSYYRSCSSQHKFEADLFTCISVHLLMKSLTCRVCIHSSRQSCFQ